MPKKAYKLRIMPRQLKKSSKSVDHKRPLATTDDQLQHKYYYDDDHGYERFDVHTLEKDELDNTNPDTQPVFCNNTKDSA